MNREKAMPLEAGAICSCGEPLTGFEIEAGLEFCSPCYRANLAARNGKGPESEESAHSWQPLNPVEQAANPPEPPMIGGLLYVGKRGLISGETESLKTWLALILAKAEMDAGFAVAWADLDAMGSGELLDRLRILGVPDETISRLFLLYEPSEALKLARLDDVCALLRDRGVRFFCIDAFNPMLGLHGLDPNSTSDVETFWREVAAPITRAGAAPTLLDHVPKSPDGRGKYAYGSERKASGAIVHIGTRALEPFARGTTGSTLLTTHKDRPGYLPRPALGRLILESDGERVGYRLEADHSRTGSSFRPTVLMERISRALEIESEPVSKDWVEKTVTGKSKALRAGLNLLVAEGYIAQRETSRGYELMSARPYREDDDAFEDLAQTEAGRGSEGVSDDNAETSSPAPHNHAGLTSSLPRPYLVPDLVSVSPDPTSSPRPPLTGDEDEDRSDTSSPIFVPSPSQDGLYVETDDPPASEPS